MEQHIRIFSLCQIKNHLSLNLEHDNLLLYEDIFGVPWYEKDLINKVKQCLNFLLEVESNNPPKRNRGLMGKDEYGFLTIDLSGMDSDLRDSIRNGTHAICGLLDNDNEISELPLPVSSLENEYKAYYYAAKTFTRFFIDDKYWRTFVNLLPWGVTHETIIFRMKKKLEDTLKKQGFLEKDRSLADIPWEHLMVEFNISNLSNPTTERSSRAQWLSLCPKITTMPKFRLYMQDHVDSLNKERSGLVNRLKQSEQRLGACEGDYYDTYLMNDSERQQLDHKILNLKNHVNELIAQIAGLDSVKRAPMDRGDRVLRLGDIANCVSVIEDTSDKKKATITFCGSNSPNNIDCPWKQAREVIRYVFQDRECTIDDENTYRKSCSKLESGAIAFSRRVIDFSKPNLPAPRIRLLAYTDSARDCVYSLSPTPILSVAVVGRCSTHEAADLAERLFVGLVVESLVVESNEVAVSNVILRVATYLSSQQQGRLIVWVQSYHDRLVVQVGR